MNVTIMHKGESIPLLVTSASTPNTDHNRLDTYIFFIETLFNT